MPINKQKKLEIPEQHFATDKPDFCVYETYKKFNRKPTNYLSINIEITMPVAYFSNQVIL